MTFILLALTLVPLFWNLVKSLSEHCSSFSITSLFLMTPQKECYHQHSWQYLQYINSQKQPSRGVHKKRCSENMQKIYRRTPMPKCNFNKVVLQLYWNHTLAWVISCKLTEYFQNTFLQEHLWVAASGAIRDIDLLAECQLIRRSLSKSLGIFDFKVCQKIKNQRARVRRNIVDYIWFSKPKFNS